MNALVLAVVFVLAASVALRGGEGGQGKTAPQSYALIVEGSGGRPWFAQNYRDWTRRLYAVLTGNAKIPARNIRLLLEKKEEAPKIASGRSTKKNVLRVLGELVGKLKADDQFVLFFIGHGTVQGAQGKFCLPGPDLDSDETAAWLSRVPAREVIFVNAASASSVFLSKASAPDRIVITATNAPEEGNETYFMEFFLQALERKAGDTDKNGRVSVLEAFRYTAERCAKWYLRQYFNHGTWRIEGKQSRRLWEKFNGQVPGKKMAAPLDPDAEDAEPLLGEWGPQWEGRRMVTEHAQLDDNGDRAGSAIFVNHTFVALKGAEKGTDGWLAGQTYFGWPRAAHGGAKTPKARKPGKVKPAP